MRQEITPPASLDGAAYQSWLRRHIELLKNTQQCRIEFIARQKKELNAIVARAQREIDNLEAQVTMRSVRK